MTRWPHWPPWPVGSRWAETQKIISAAWKAWGPARQGAVAQRYPYTAGPFDSLAQPKRPTAPRTAILGPPNGRDGRWYAGGPSRTCWPGGWWNLDASDARSSWGPHIPVEDLTP